MKKGLTIEELEKVEMGKARVKYNGRVYKCTDVYTGGVELRDVVSYETIKVSTTSLYCDGCVIDNLEISEYGRSMYGGWYCCYWASKTELGWETFAKYDGLRQFLKDNGSSVVKATRCDNIYA